MNIDAVHWCANRKYANCTTKLTQLTKSSDWKSKQMLLARLSKATKNIIQKIYTFLCKTCFFSVPLYMCVCKCIFSFNCEFLSNWRLFWIWNLKYKYLFTSDSHFTYTPQMFIELEIRWLVKITEWINLVFDTWKIRCIFLS